MWANILKHKKTLIILLVIILGLGFITYQKVSVSGIFSDLKNDLKEIEPEEGSSYQNLNGEIVHLTDFKGKILVINSWATWSPYSKDELNILSELQTQFGDEVSTLAINRKERLPLIRSYLKTYGLEESTVIYLIDPTDHFYTTSGGFAMPETIIYRRDGTISSHYRGTIKRDVVVDVIEGLLE